MIICPLKLRFKLDPQVPETFWQIKVLPNFVWRNTIICFFGG